ncbi:CpaF family protein [Shewanella frigidimarina]|uniref:CpaF family protein n=1 Tax=Shewanella frigidimarina TaxID=56812 RepID=UPI003F9ECDE8
MFNSEHNIFSPTTLNVSSIPNDEMRRLKQLLHNSLIDDMDNDDSLHLKKPTQLKQQLEQLIDLLPGQQQQPLNASDKALLIQQVIEELQGLGPISELMLDPAVTDILINGPFSIWVERHGALRKTTQAFDNDSHLRRFLERIVSAQGRQLDANNPMVDARLADGSRLHAVIPPLCNIGAVVSIRRFHHETISAETLVSSGFISQDILTFLEKAVIAGINIVIAGSAGSGKTSLLNVISGFIPNSERVITIEETGELQLHHPHVIPLESRGTNGEGNGEVSLRDLVKTALRMRADRIIVGEVRGGEVFDMLQAMNCGHDGSLTTVHANNPQDVINRLRSLAQMEEAAICRDTIDHMISSSIQVIVQVRRFRDGSRRVVSVCEVIQTAAITEVKPLFEFQQQPQTDHNHIVGQHVCSATQCQLSEQIAAKGFDVTELNSLFSEVDYALV